MTEQKLITVLVILACSRNGTLTVSEAVESLKCAEEIVDEMGSNEKKTWLLKNGPRVKKLYEKVLRQDIAAVVQCAVRSVPHTVEKIISKSQIGIQLHCNND